MNEFVQNTVTCGEADASVPEYLNTQLLQFIGTMYTLISILPCITKKCFSNFTTDLWKYSHILFDFSYFVAVVEVVTIRTNNTDIIINRY